ncbi:hypothetical protein ACWDA7_28005 [Streptomyces sp. NPDC001156]
MDAHRHAPPEKRPSFGYVGQPEIRPSIPYGLVPQLSPSATPVDIHNAR